MDILAKGTKLPGPGWDPGTGPATGDIALESDGVKDDNCTGSDSDSDSDSSSSSVESTHDVETKENATGSNLQVSGESSALETYPEIVLEPELEPEPEPELEPKPEPEPDPEPEPEPESEPEPELKLETELTTELGIQPEGTLQSKSDARPTSNQGCASSGETTPLPAFASKTDPGNAHTAQSIRSIQVTDVEEGVPPRAATNI